MVWRRTNAPSSIGFPALCRREAAGLRTGPVGTWVHANLTILRLALVALAGLVFVFIDRPTGQDVLVLAALLVVALAILEFLARPPHPEPAPASTGPV